MYVDAVPPESNKDTQTDAYTTENSIQTENEISEIGIQTFEMQIFLKETPLKSEIVSEINHNSNKKGFVYQHNLAEFSNFENHLPEKIDNESKILKNDVAISLNSCLNSCNNKFLTLFPKQLKVTDWNQINEQIVSKILPKMDESVFKNINLNSLFASFSKNEIAFLSSRRLSAISVHYVQEILLNNDLRDIISICYDFYFSLSGIAKHTLTTLTSLFNYCKQKTNNCSTKIDIFLTLIPFKPLNSIGVFKELLKNMYTHMDD